MKLSFESAYRTDSRWLPRPEPSFSKGLIVGALIAVTFGGLAEHCDPEPVPLPGMGCARHAPPPEPHCVETLFSPGACATCIYTAPDYELAEDLEARCGKVCR